MNFYDILEITHNSTKTDIKKAYHRLVIKYHPDKNKDKDTNSEKKFIEIKTAYEILYDDEKRMQYDNMTIEQKTKLFDLLNNYFTDIKPQYQSMYDKFIEIIYRNDKDEFKTDINSFKIKKIFKKILESYESYENELYHSNEIIHKIIPENYVGNDIIIDLDVTLYERYIEKLINLKLIDKNNIDEYFISINSNKKIVDINGGKGKLIINFKFLDDINFKLINEYDFYISKKISLSQYLYGSEIKIVHLDGKIFKLKFESCLEKKPIFLLKNKGLKYNEDEYGDLIIYLTIEGINSPINDLVSKEYSKVVEETIKLMFPPIDV